MFIQQDWLMRQIEMIISAIIRLFFGKDGQGSGWEEALRQTRAAEPKEELAGLLDEKQLGKAEDLLFQSLDPEDGSILAVAVDFYQRANAMTDQELEAQGFTREELLEGLGQAVERYGVYLPGLWDRPPES